MEQNIRSYVDELFTNTPVTRNSVELKEEMIQNLTEKHNDLISEGKTPEAAYNIAIAGIGDVSGLLMNLEKNSAHKDSAAYRQRSAMLTSIAIMMYILSVVPLIVLGALVHTPAASVIGLAVMFLLIAAATGLLIYNGMTKPRFHRNDTIVEEFRQWQSGNKQEKTLRKAIGTALWTITVAIYFIVSFTSGMWHLTWLIFPAAAAVQAITNAAFALKN